MQHIITTAWKVLHGNFLKNTKNFVSYLEEQGISPDIVLQVVPDVGDFWIIKSGPRKGITVRRFVQRDWNPTDRVKLAEAISQCSENAIDAAFHFVKNEKQQTMYSLVLGNTDPEYKDQNAEYISQWMAVYLENRWCLDRLAIFRFDLLEGLDTTKYAD